jgi:hypothetical protein
MLDEAAQLTEKEEADWRAEFERLGREAVRQAAYFHPGNLNPRRKYALALRWLHEKEIKQEARERNVAWYVKWTWDAALAAAVLAAIGILVAILHF